MPAPPASRLMSVVRVALAGITLVVAGTWGVFTWRPGWVDALDLALERRVTEPRERAYEDAVARLEDDRESGRAQLAALAAELGTPRKGDRLFDLRARVAERITEDLAAAGELERAVGAAETWAALDDRNITARVRHAVLLAGLPGHRAEALEQLRAVHALVPESVGVTEQLLRLLREDQAWDAIVEVLADHLGATRSNLWQVVATGEGWGGPAAERLSAYLDERGRLTLAFRLAPGTDTLRLEAPMNRFLRFRGAQLVLREPDQEVRVVPIDETTTELFRVGVKAGELTSGNLPRMTLVLDPAVGPGGADVRFTASVAPTLSQGVRRVLGDLEARGVLLRTAVERPDLWPKLVEARTRWLLEQPMQLFVAVEGAAFGADASVAATARAALASGEALPWEASFDVAAPARRVRLDLPQGVGVEYRIEAVDVAGGDPRTFGPPDVARAELHDVSRTPRGLVVDGPDPYLVLDLASQVEVSSVRVRGWAR